jgi:hypothetical protein
MSRSHREPTPLVMPKLKGIDFPDLGRYPELARFMKIASGPTKASFVSYVCDVYREAIEKSLELFQTKDTEAEDG